MSVVVKPLMFVFRSLFILLCIHKRAHSNEALLGCDQEELAKASDLDRVKLRALGVKAKANAIVMAVKVDIVQDRGLNFLQRAL